jgi:hypothetical protein
MKKTPAATNEGTAPATTGQEVTKTKRARRKVATFLLMRLNEDPATKVCTVTVEADAITVKALRKVAASKPVGEYMIVSKRDHFTISAPTTNVITRV